MYKYKRGINNLEQAKRLEFCLSNNLKTYLTMTACLENKKPFHALYIRNNKVMVENVIEKIEVADKVYRMAELNTSTQTLSCDEYISSIDLSSYTFEYDTDECSYLKTIYFIEKEDILCIDYEIKNKTQSQINFSFIPLITYRDMFTMKKTARLKFNQREVENGQLINLSVMDKENIVIKSDNAEFNQEIKYLNNVKHEYIDDKLSKKIYTEDLYVPGEFNVKLKANETKKVKIYFSDKDFSVSEYASYDMLEEKQEKLKDLSNKIKDEYVELKDMAIVIDNLDMEEQLIPSIPYVSSSQNVIQDLTNIIQAVEGQYLVPKKIKEAKRALIRLKKSIEDIDYSEDNEKELVLLKLWYIESLNRVLQKSNNDSDIEIYFSFVRNIVDGIIVENETVKKAYMKYIEVISLWYNALKIYENMLNKQNIDSTSIYMLAEETKNTIVNDFWNEEKRIMKYNLDEKENYANVSMIYTLSLSYQCVAEDIPAKLLDTIFKELYTPYGLREISKNSDKNNGYIYPKYMAHFVKANLRQNGVTRASQKIAYNLIKELVLDIGKYVNGGIKKVYHEKGINIDSVTFDLLTNAEIMRLYDMLT